MPELDQSPNPQLEHVMCPYCGREDVPLSPSGRIDWHPVKLYACPMVGLTMEQAHTIMSNSNAL